MPKSTLAGHPLHPQLISAPAGLLPASLVLDAMYMATGKESYADAAYYTMVGGVLGGLGAAAAGAADYLTIPSGTQTKRLGNAHAALNVGIIALFGANIFMRRGKRPPTGQTPFILSAVGNTALLVSAWYGGEMIYKQGMRVEGVSPVAEQPEIRPPGDAGLATAFDKAVRWVPETGPQT